jgi:hypothetical protein
MGAINSQLTTLKACVVVASEGTHKLLGMINVRSKHCEHAGCNTTASFNDDGERGGRFCATHMLQGMVHFSKKSKL